MKTVHMYICFTGHLISMYSGHTSTYVHDTESSYSYQTSNTVRRRRQLDTTDDGFATTCEARFTLRDGATNTYVLVWACPAGGEPPSLMAQEEICRFLFERRLVESCYAPTTAIFTEDQMPLPPARYSITLKLNIISG